MTQNSATTTPWNDDDATGPLKGIKVVEVAAWAAGPMAGGILADWGADVIKIEPLDGDPYRALNIQPGLRPEGLVNHNFFVANRGKRSISIDLKKEQGRQLAYRLIAQADVFLTNVRRQALERIEMHYSHLHELFPQLVYCHLTGYGIKGPDIDRPAYDIGAFFARAGVGATLLTEEVEPMMRTGAFGDYYTAFSAASGVCAALVGRQLTGRGQLVSTSLLRAGAFCVSHSFNQVLFGYPPSGERKRNQSFNPMITCYRDSNRKWFYLLGLQGDRIWPAVARSIGRPELEKDPRFDSLANRTRNGPALIALLDEAFAARPLAEWREIFDREGVWWSPVQNVREALEDPQMRAAGAFTKVDTPEGEREMVPPPVDFDETPWNVRCSAPEAGQHTEDVMLGMGLDWEEIARLKEQGVIV
jgi:crotonobetainyl-CoA:carnitine CoA-transferase CaiB-like acyl-CoA transferase